MINIDLKKTVFNSQHNITIKGFDVELFVEDEKSGNKSAGEFSILNNRWNKIPDFEAFELGALPKLTSEGQLMAYHHDGFWQPMDTLREKQDLARYAEQDPPPWMRNF